MSELTIPAKEVVCVALMNRWNKIWEVKQRSFVVSKKNMCILS